MIDFLFSNNNASSVENKLIRYLELMRVLIFEDNLMWSARLKKTVNSLGHEADLLGSIPKDLPQAEAAIVNLGSTTMDAQTLVPLLKEKGIYVIAHAGHKEKQLQELGKTLACDKLASNSELTFKLKEILDGVPERI
ncbi:MAG TPA: hypothetical protein VGL56_20675 [Fimbriimonadaceae bacterium]|jgi:hypothetical protein